MNQTPVLETQLQRHFNYSTFQPGQKEIIEDVLKGNDVIGILPTGSGKSLCYQLPAKLLEGTTIVISPLISLMMDQVKQLKASQFKEVVALTSFIPYGQRQCLYKTLHRYKLVYMSPELLQQQEVMDELKKIKVSLFVIDEAHCISQWGFEFRPDYLKLDLIIRQLENPPVLALSATVTEAIQRDIRTALKRPHMIQHIYPMDKENIIFTVKEVLNNNEKMTCLLRILRPYRLPAIIYFSSRAEAEIIAQRLSNELAAFRIAYYHGGMESIDRVMVQQQFMNDQLDIVCCTSAFGMGINKSNIRLVIHYHLPAQLEAFIQEVGRSGRDGKSSVSLLLYSKNDVNIHQHLIHKELPSEEEINEVWEKLYIMHLQRQLIPPEAEKKFELNENQWRFLHYQAEKHGMITNNIINFEPKTWESSRKQIQQFKNERQLIKQQKLNEMVDWIYEKGCLRKRLYANFQEGYKEPAVSCCKNCGFSLTDWNADNPVIDMEQSLTWRDQLKQILLVGELNETDGVN
ncbi:RecQ family ATP-dependent DNA helicase [Virgibacillus sp. W0181]|uniref:RecQ family ATP-dependent DNA helicase n=1 Tax=Virgibacillus sp. W0181 TaxID=3391581 RepID=UPI003F4682D7